MDPLATRRLGRTPIALTRLGLGGAPFGGLYGRVDEADAAATVEAAYAGGVRYFDTAPWYGHGRSEHRVGHVLRQKPRESFVLSTKVGRVYARATDPDGFDPGKWLDGLPFELRFDYGQDGIMRSYEDSLMRLGLARVDLLIVHDLDFGYHPGEAFDARLGELDGGFRALERLRASGGIGAIGVGINDAALIVRFLDRYDVDFFLVAMPYTLLDQGPLDDVFPRLLERGIAVVIGSPFASGILATGPIAGASYAVAPASAAILDKTRRIQTVCERHGVPLPAAALQFPLAHPAVAAIVPGARSAAQVEQNLAHMRHAIPPDLWAELKTERLLHSEAPVPTRRRTKAAGAERLPD
jgi:D-threo-aldose 1-dehydrogenase